MGRVISKPDHILQITSTAPRCQTVFHAPVNADPSLNRVVSCPYVANVTGHLARIVETKIMPPLIRPATPNDVEQVRSIRRLVLPPDDPYEYERNILVPSCLNLVAERAGMVDGYITVLLRIANPLGRFVWQRIAPYIGFLGIRPEAQRQGIGKALLGAVIAEVSAGRIGASHLFLEYDRNNAALEHLYRGMGFLEIDSDALEKLIGLRPKDPLMGYPLRQGRTPQPQQRQDSN